MARTRTNARDEGTPLIFPRADCSLVHTALNHSRTVIRTGVVNCKMSDLLNAKNVD